MATPATIVRGDSVIVQRTLLQADGVTALNVSSLAGAQVELIQFGQTLATYVLGTNVELRTGDAANRLWLELKPAVTHVLAREPLTLRWEFRITDAAFAASANIQTKRVQETPIKVT